MKSSSDYVVYCIDGSMLAAVNHINFIEIVSFIFQLWACATPFQDLMVVGIDVYHDNTRKCGSIAGVVTSLNDLATRYYSVAVEQKQGQEIMDALRLAFIEGIIKYWETNRKWPANIVVFRDGGTYYLRPSL